MADLAEYEGVGEPVGATGRHDAGSEDDPRIASSRSPTGLTDDARSGCCARCPVQSRTGRTARAMVEVDKSLAGEADAEIPGRLYARHPRRNTRVWCCRRSARKSRPQRLNPLVAASIIEGGAFCLECRPDVFDRVAPKRRLGSLPKSSLVSTISRPNRCLLSRWRRSRTKAAVTPRLPAWTT